VNIWSPANSTEAKLPVIVWSYGAGGVDSNAQYDGAGIASKGVVFVNYNYRTGPLGWLTLPELTAESSTNSSGNYGLLDQIEVLKWVKANIASFGGDPDQVTAVGQSFGAGAAYHIVNSPLAKGLIKGAIAESGIKDPYDPNMIGYGSDYRNLSWSYAFGEAFADSLNATSVADLRALDTATILTGAGVSDFESFDPVLDGYAIPSTYYESLQNGSPNDVPIIAGNNQYEDDASTSNNFTVAEYESATNTTYGPYAAELLELYPAGDNYSTATTSYNTRALDIARTSTWSFANRWVQNNTSPVYVYYWNHAPPDQTQGAYHGSEINYVLINLYATTTTNWTDTDWEIAEIMSSYWVNFAKTGNPNDGGTYTAGNLTYWPPTTAEEEAFEVGDGWGNVPIATSEQVKTLLEWFKWATPNPY
jgi:carboxylesterase 2